MNKEKFTNGEWRINFGSQDCYFNQENEKQFYSTNYSMLTNEKTSIEEIEKNIKLIAAAPEMYDMLESFLCLDGIIKTDKINALLAKARGEHE